MYVAQRHNITHLWFVASEFVNQQTLTGAMLKEETPKSTRCFAISFFVSDTASYNFKERWDKIDFINSSQQKLGKKFKLT